MKRAAGLRVLLIAGATWMAGVCPRHLLRQFRFEPGAVGDRLRSRDSSITGTFNVTGGSVDVVGPAFFAGLCATPPETGSCIDIDASSAGTMTSSPIPLVAGHSYTLAFDLFGSQRGADTSTTVSLGAFYSQTFLAHSADQNIVSTSLWPAPIPAPTSCSTATMPLRR